MDSIYLIGSLCLLSQIAGLHAEDVKCVEAKPSIEAIIGDDVSLPCFFSNPSEIQGMASVSWQMGLGNDSIVVHAEDKAGVNVESQADVFKGRTSLSHSWNVTGNASLTITQIKATDSGKYICFIKGQYFAISCTRLELTVRSGAFQPCGHLSAWIVLLLLPLTKILT
ncbi:myelin-oligodendrocyte glycoprotein-like [Carcharodon carcharias]|uniref:myelin-oligodendrocyte glycoprotein-like n=1 Tax=Carcharodon carcharias TaxID=13397 RepID=UPI001B7DBD7E|nr:myelin-oligodendrocyte glycoprotein-like [Carcharodon carcharias]